jgi:hypothetical protein
LNRCCVCEVAKARFAREEFGLGPVRFTNKGAHHLDLAEFNPNRFFAFPAALNVGLNDALFINDFLEVVLKEIIIGF